MAFYIQSPLEVVAAEEMRPAFTPTLEKVLLEIGPSIRIVTCCLGCDLYAIRFILSYDGNNPEVLRLQMWLMCWDVDIVHHIDIHLMDADYWSHLGAGSCYDPLFKLYLNFDRGLREMFLAPIKLPMLPENMPYYRGQRVIPPLAPTDEPSTNVKYCQSLFTQIATNDCQGLSHLSVTPIKFGEPFCIKLACDQYDFGRALFREFTQCTQIFENGKDLLNHICTYGDSSQIHGYLIHSL